MWYLVSEEDHMIPPATEQWMAERMASQEIVSLGASHASLASHPDAVVALIEDAANGLHQRHGGGDPTGGHFVRRALSVHRTVACVP